MTVRVQVLDPDGYRVELYALAGEPDAGALVDCRPVSGEAIPIIGAPARSATAWRCAGPGPVARS